MISLAAAVLLLLSGSLSYRLSVTLGSYYAGFLVAGSATVAAYFAYRYYRGRPGADYLPLIAVLPNAALALILLGGAITGHTPPAGLSVETPV